MPTPEYLLVIALQHTTSRPSVNKARLSRIYILWRWRMTKLL